MLLKIHNMNTKTQPVGVTELRRRGEEGPALGDSVGMGSPLSSHGATAVPGEFPLRKAFLRN